MIWQRFGLATGLAAMALGGARAEGVTIAECSESVGYAYFFEGGAVPAGEGGWRPDRISEGRISLVQDTSGEFDILLLDSAGLRSAKSEGAKVIRLPSQGPRLAILVFYAAGASEQYVFDLQSRPKRVAWTSVKYAGLVDKAAAFEADCD